MRLAIGCQRTAAVSRLRPISPLPDERVRRRKTHLAELFATTGMRLLAGRPFEDRDPARRQGRDHQSRNGRRYFQIGVPVGRHFGYGTPDTEIVGVVEDARVNRVQESATADGILPDGPADPAARSLDVRAIGDPRSITADVRRVVIEVDNALPIGGVTLLSNAVASGLRQERLIASLTSLFGMWPSAWPGWVCSG